MATGKPNTIVGNANPSYSAQNKMPALRIKDIVQLIQQHSLATTWEQAYRCPCVDIDTGQPKPNCGVCHGQGWVYLHPRKLDMAIQSDQKKYSLVSNGMDQQGISQATPQITVNGIEQGIKPGDRITVDGWTTNETYTVNITEQRLNGGIFLPYKVEGLNEAFYIEDDQLVQLDPNKNFSLKDNWLQIKSEGLLDKTISLSLEVIKRFYVVSLSKEVRYEKYVNLQDKMWATGNGQGDLEPCDTDSSYKDESGNQILSTEDLESRGSRLPYPQVIKRDGQRIVPGKHQIYRLPPLLMLRRENLYFSDLNVVNSETDNRSVIQDPRVNDLQDFIGD